VIYIYLRQTVEDYARWKEGFDNHIVARQAGGATDEAYVMRNVDNPNDITVVLGWCDLEKARAFSQSVGFARGSFFGGNWLSGPIPTITVSISRAAVDQHLSVATQPSFLIVSPSNKLKQNLGPDWTP
jgi:hypothetical protein